MDTSLKEQVIIELIKSNVVNAENLRNASGWHLEVLIDNYRRLSSCGSTPMDRLAWQEAQIRALRLMQSVLNCVQLESTDGTPTYLITNFVAASSGGRRLSSL